MAEKNPKPNVDDLIAENQALKDQVAQFNAQQQQAAADEQEARERIAASGGALTMEQAKQCVAYQRAWDKDPKNPNNQKPAAAAAPAASADK